MSGNEDFLRELKELTYTEYETAKSKARKSVIRLIGEKPTREKFKKDMGSIFGPMDIFSLIVFLAAFLVSSFHIMEIMGEMANDIYSFGVITEVVNGEEITRGHEGGFYIDRHTYILAHQLGYLVLAEASMLLFMVMWRLETIDKDRSFKLSIFGWSLSIPLKKFFSVYFLLAFIAMAFIFWANTSSGLELLTSLMPPVFTIGIGLNIEKLVTTWMIRKEKISQLFEKAYSHWEKYNDNPEEHPEFNRLFSLSIWDLLQRKNKWAQDAKGYQKIAAVHREMERDEWSDLAAVDSIKEETSDHEMGKEDVFYSLVVKATSGVVSHKGYVANIDELFWEKDGKKMGPYTTKPFMLMGIRHSLKVSSK